MATNKKFGFPLIGNVYEGDFGVTPIGELCIEDTCSPEYKMTVSATKGPMKGLVDTVNSTITEIRPGLFLVTFKEKSGNTVIELQDFEKGVIYLNAVMSNGTFVEQLKGTWKKIKPSEAKFIKP